MDDQSVLWSQDRFNEIKTGLLPFLLQTGYKEEDIFWVPISGLTGQNIKERVDSKECPWFEGNTLFEILDKLPLEKRDPEGPLRIPIIDKMREQGIVAFGKIESGTLRLGDKL